MAGTRKGKGEKKLRARGRAGVRVCGRARVRARWWAGGGGERKAPAANPLFTSSFSFADEQKIATGSFLIVCQSLPHTTF